MDNGKGRSRNRVKDAYNKACEAVDEYNYQHPGTELQLDTLNLADNDPHNENDVQIPVDFTHCDNITRMGQELSEFAGTHCYVGYRTDINGDEVLPRHILHVDPRGIYQDDNDTVFAWVSQFMELPLPIRILTLALLLYVVSKIVM
jgi:hypothetical protein